MICERPRAHTHVAPTRRNREMNTRLIIPLLIAGALAFACGPRSRTEAPESLASALPIKSLNAAVPRATPGSQVTQVSHSRRKDAAKPTAKIDSKLNVAVDQRDVRLALDIKNVGTKHVELTFPSGQTYEFVVVDSVGREVWRWSDRRMFTQGVQNKQLGTGDSMLVSETWTPTAKPGHYTVIATLKSSNYPVEQRADIVLQ
jgi:intracellular proteinase inhibitor BsuPI